MNFGPRAVFEAKELIKPANNTHGMWWLRTEDPVTPCRVFRVDPDNRRVVQRSTDLGETWETVFRHDGVSNGQPFRARRIYAPRADLVYVVEDTNGTALVRTRDGGRTWEPANGVPAEGGSGGIAGEAVWDVAIAPSNPNVVYAVTMPCERSSNRPSFCDAYGHSTIAQIHGETSINGAIEIHVTKDGGATWARRLTIGTQVTYAALTVDPADPSHAFVNVLTTGRCSSVGGHKHPDLYETDDFGEHFVVPEQRANATVDTTPGGVGSGQNPISVNDGCPGGTNEGIRIGAARSRADGLRLYWAEGTEELEWTTDRGRTFTGSSFRGSVAFPGIDPRDNDRLFSIFQATTQDLHEIIAGFTRDGFAPDPDGERRFEFVNSLGFHPKSRAWYATSGRADNQGNFYVDFALECATVACVAGGQAAANETWWEFQTLRYTPPPEPHEKVKPGGGKVEERNCLSGGPCLPLVPVLTCDVAGQFTPGPAARSLAFDGHELLVPGPTGPGPFAATVHRVDPATCRHKGTMTVRFDPDDYRAAIDQTENEAGEPTLAEDAPTIDTLTYDPHRDRLWFSLGHDAGVLDVVNPIAIWSVPLGDPDASDHRSVTRPAELAFGTALCQQADDGMERVGAEWLAFDSRNGDAAKDTIYSCQPNAPAELRPNGSRTFQCFNRGPFIGFGITEGVATGAAGHIFVMFDDLGDYDTATCADGQLFETELVSGELGNGSATGSVQFPCDPATFGVPELLPPDLPVTLPELPGGVPQGLSVLWFRQGARLVAANYPAVNTPHCTLPTAMILDDPDHVDAGSTARLCATITLVGPDVGIRGLPIDFTVGREQVDTAKSDERGRACVDVERPAGQYPVRANWIGSTAYEPAEATGLLTVGGVTTALLKSASPQGERPRPAPQPDPVIAPIVVPFVAPAQVLSFNVARLTPGQVPPPPQIPAQGQATSQSASAEERQRQRQLATQESDREQEEPAKNEAQEFSATPVASHEPSPFRGFASALAFGFVGLLGWGVASALRRPEPAYAYQRQSWHRR